MSIAIGFPARMLKERSSFVLSAFLFAFANGISETVFRSIHSNGFLPALSVTFGVSVIVLAALFVASQNLTRADDRSLEKRDIPWLAGAVLLALLPSPQFSWVSITMLALYELRISTFGSMARKGATLMFGLTIPMFWGKIVFSLFSGWILRGDALLVSVATHSSTNGNMVVLPHQSGFMTVAPACSSFANVSLAVLCWLMFTVYSGRARTFADYVVCVSACINVVIVNVVRISLIGMRPDLYDLLHGPIGAGIASWLTALIVVWTCYSGVKRASIESGNDTISDLPPCDDLDGVQDPHVSAAGSSGYVQRSKAC